MSNILSELRMEMASGTVFGYFLQAVPITIVVGIVYTILRLMYLKRKKCHVAWLSEAMRLLFICYLTGLCSLIILPQSFWLRFFDGIFFGWWEYLYESFHFGEVNLIPSIVLYLSGEITLGSWVKTMIVGNVAMFIPFGFFLPFVTEKLNRKNIFVVAAIVPLSMELLQLFFGRSFDIDDLICNFLGIVIGFFIAYGIAKIRSIISGSK